MRLFSRGPIKLFGVDQTNLKRYGFPWRFRMDRKPSAQMELKGCTVYPFSADHRFTYGTDPHACLDRRNTFSIEPVKVVIQGSKSGRITVALNEFFFLGSHEVPAPEYLFTIDESGDHVLGWPYLKRANIAKTWNSDGTPREYEEMLAYPFAARISIKRGRSRDLIEFSLFYCTEPPAPGLPYYAPVWIIKGDGKHIKMDYSACS